MPAGSGRAGSWRSDGTVWTVSTQLARERTESIYKICAERFASPTHLQVILTEAQVIVDAAIAPAASS